MSRRNRHIAAPALVCAGLGLILAPATAAGPPTGRALPIDASFQQRCEALTVNLFDELPGAPTQIVSAKIVQPKDLAPMCEVTGYIAPQIGIAARLPVAGWNGKLLVTGCDDLCGSIPVQTLDDAYEQSAKRGYAVITSDMGHHFGEKGRALLWAAANLQARMDFGFRATHVTTVLGKALVERFYGRKQRYSYFSGCSTGGRQGMVEAQRYPDDFDGIVVGAAPIRYNANTFQLAWSALANLDADNKPILDRQAVTFLHASMIAACDARDGLRDGLIADPRMCRFKVEDLLCKAGRTTGCLTAAQADAARKIYQGPVDSHNRLIYVGGAEIGSEMNWLGDYVQDGARPSLLLKAVADKLRYLAFDTPLPPDWTPRDIDWDTDPERAIGQGAIYSAVNPDLSRFRARGGKLLQYHGWADENVIPRVSTDYYDIASRTMGGIPATQTFYRLFMVPGMNHCVGGEGAWKIDWLSALESWVERGKAPDRLIGTHPATTDSAEFSRPIFPYPAVARYNGGGSANANTSFIRRP